MIMNFKNSPKVEFCFSESEIWYAWLGKHKDAMIIMLKKIYQLYCKLYKKYEWLKSAGCKIPVPDLYNTYVAGWLK